MPNSANLVIIAANYNPSIVSKEWLYQKGILTDTVRNFVHTPVFSLVEADQFSLIVDEQRLQLAVRKTTQENLQTAPTIAARFVDALPETPYTALGFNYHYVMSKEECDISNIFSPNHERIRKLISETYELGATLAFEFERFTVTLNMSPATGPEKRIRMGFNFHADAKGVDEVKSGLSRQLATLEEADKIVQGLCSK